MPGKKKGIFSFKYAKKPIKHCINAIKDCKTAINMVDIFLIYRFTKIFINIFGLCKSAFNENC